MEIENKAEIIVAAIEEKKGENIKVYDVNSSICDKVIIATALNDRNANAISENVLDKLEENKINYKSVEGKNTKWIVIDAYDIIIHIFDEVTRTHFDLDNFLTSKK